MKIRPWTIILTMLAGWVNQHQQDVIEYLKTENAILKEKIGKKRIILSDEQRRRLAVLAKRIGCTGLNEICGIFSPEIKSMPMAPNFSPTLRDLFGA